MVKGVLTKKIKFNVIYWKYLDKITDKLFINYEHPTEPCRRYLYQVEKYYFKITKYVSEHSIYHYLLMW